MANYKVEFVGREDLLALDVGDTWQDMPIISTIPGYRQAIIELPDDWTLMQVGLFFGSNVADIVDWRPEHEDYQILGFPDVGALAEGLAVGDTFLNHGLTADVLTRGKSGEGAVIAICDTGIDSRHSFFQGVNVTGDLNDGHGHGTHMGSIAGGNKGIAPKAHIISFKVLDDSGRGSEASVANGIRAAAEAGADEISLSLGGGPSQVIDDACTYAKTLGSIVIAAAGNTPNAPIGSPARSADIIVLACDRQDQPASFTSGRNWSNANRTYGNGVSIEAALTNTLNGTIIFSGTSPATPHIAALDALLKSNGMSRTDRLAYLFSHRVTPPESPGKTFMRADFGGTVPEPVPGPARRWVRFFLEFTLSDGSKQYAAGDVDAPP